MWVLHQEWNSDCDQGCFDRWRSYHLEATIWPSKYNALSIALFVLSRNKHKLTILFFHVNPFLSAFELSKFMSFLFRLIKCFRYENIISHESEETY